MNNDADLIKITRLNSIKALISSAEVKIIAHSNLLFAASLLSDELTMAREQKEAMNATAQLLAAKILLSQFVLEHNLFEIKNGN